MICACEEKSSRLILVGIALDLDFDSCGAA